MKKIICLGLLLLSSFSHAETCQTDSQCIPDPDFGEPNTCVVGKVGTPAGGASRDQSTYFDLGFQCACRDARCVLAPTGKTESRVLEFVKAYVEKKFPRCKGRAVHEFKVSKWTDLNHAFVILHCVCGTGCSHNCEIETLVSPVKTWQVVEKENMCDDVDHLGVNGIRTRPVATHSDERDDRFNCSADADCQLVNVYELPTDNRPAKTLVTCWSKNTKLKKDSEWPATLGTNSSCSCKKNRCSIN